MTLSCSTILVGAGSLSAARPLQPNQRPPRRRSVGLILDDASYHQQKQQRQADKIKLLEALYEAKVLVGDVDSNAPELPEKVRTAIFDFLRATPSKLFAFTQDDLTRFPEQQNMPGTTWQHPNWRHKMPVAIEDLPPSA